MISGPVCTRPTLNVVQKNANNDGILHEALITSLSLAQEGGQEKNLAFYNRSDIKALFPLSDQNNPVINPKEQNYFVWWERFSFSLDELFPELSTEYIAGISLFKVNN